MKSICAYYIDIDKEQGKAVLPIAQTRALIFIMQGLLYYAFRTILSYNFLQKSIKGSGKLVPQVVKIWVERYE